MSFFSMKQLDNNDECNKFRGMPKDSDDDNKILYKNKIHRRLSFARDVTELV